MAGSPLHYCYTPLQQHIICADTAIAAHLCDLLKDMSVRDAAKATAEALNVSKARAYELALALKKDAGT